MTLTFCTDVPDQQPCAVLLKRQKLLAEDEDLSQTRTVR